MNRYSERFSQHNTSPRNRLIEVKPFHRSDGRSFGELIDNLRLKRFLKRVVEKELAPQSLIDSIKEGIRR